MLNDAVNEWLMEKSNKAAAAATQASMASDKKKDAANETSPSVASPHRVASDFVFIDLGSD